MRKKNKVVAVTGPTATGKTAFAVALARQFGGEIVSIDSRQVFRGMDIGSGKDQDEYRSGGDEVGHHLIDIVDPGEDYHLMRFCRDAAATVTDIVRRGLLPVCCGGTPLYLDALLRGYTLPGAAPDPDIRQEMRGRPVAELLRLLKEKSPEQYARLKDRENPNRIIRALEMCGNPAPQVEPVAAMIDPLVIGIYLPRREVHRRIEERLDRRLAGGMIEEVAGLHSRGISWERLEFFGLEYRYAAMFLQGKLELGEMRDQLLFRIRQFAKRQDIWFRKMEREGLRIYWLPPDALEEAAGLLRAHLRGETLPEPSLKLMNIHYGPVTSGHKQQEQRHGRATTET